MKLSYRRQFSVDSDVQSQQNTKNNNKAKYHHGKKNIRHVTVLDIIKFRKQIK